MAGVSAVLKPEAHEEHIQIGLDDGYSRKMAGSLSDILIATYRLVIKSHLYHWNVVGPLFKPLHELTEDHYGELFEAADIVAERIRALGYLAPVETEDAAQFAPNAGDVRNRSAVDMINDLIADHENACRAMRKAAFHAGEAGDLVTEDMLTQRLTFHEKAVWMLRAIVAE